MLDTIPLAEDADLREEIIRATPAMRGGFKIAPLVKKPVEPNNKLRQPDEKEAKKKLEESEIQLQALLKLLAQNEMEEGFDEEWIESLPDGIYRGSRKGRGRRALCTIQMLYFLQLAQTTHMPKLSPVQIQILQQLQQLNREIAIAQRLPEALAIARIESILQSQLFLQTIQQSMAQPQIRALGPLSYAQAAQIIMQTASRESIFALQLAANRLEQYIQAGQTPSVERELRQMMEAVLIAKGQMAATLLPAAAEPKAAAPLLLQPLSLAPLEQIAAQTTRQAESVFTPASVQIAAKEIAPLLEQAAENPLTVRRDIPLAAEFQQQNIITANAAQIDSLTTTITPQRINTPNDNQPQERLIVHQKKEERVEEKDQPQTQPRLRPVLRRRHWNTEPSRKEEPISGRRPGPSPRGRRGGTTKQAEVKVKPEVIQIIALPAIPLPTYMPPAVMPEADDLLVKASTLGVCPKTGRPGCICTPTLKQRVESGFKMAQNVWEKIFNKDRE
ncbi:MAG: hypothetical protein AB7U41_05650 [Dongiaceae bacterium]